MIVLDPSQVPDSTLRIVAKLFVSRAERAMDASSRPLSEFWAQLAQGAYSELGMSHRRKLFTITADVSRVPDRELAMVAKLWFTLCRDDPEWSPQTPMGDFVWQLATEVQSELDDRAAAFDAIEADVEGVGGLVAEGTDPIEEARKEMYGHDGPDAPNDL